MSSLDEIIFRSSYSVLIIVSYCRKYERSVKHWVIAAKLGYHDSLDALKDAYGQGYVRKEDLTVALRGHQAALDATKSLQRVRGGTELLGEGT